MGCEDWISEGIICVKCERALPEEERKQVDQFFNIPGAGEPYRP